MAGRPAKGGPVRQRLLTALQIVTSCALTAVLAGCPSSMPSAESATASLENTYWKLVRLGDQPVEAGEQRREPHIVLQPDQKRVVGSGGCNNMGGSYVLEGGQLRFSQMFSTKMACAEGMEQEQAFLAALEKVASWRIEGERLELFDAAGQSIARFESRYME